MEYKSQFTSNLEEVIRSVQLDQRKKSSAAASSSSANAAATANNKSSSSSKTDVSSNNDAGIINRDNTARDATDTAIDVEDDEGGGGTGKSSSRGSIHLMYPSIM